MPEFTDQQKTKDNPAYIDFLIEGLRAILTTEYLWSDESNTLRETIILLKSLIPWEDGHNDHN